MRNSPRRPIDAAIDRRNELFTNQARLDVQALVDRYARLAETVVAAEINPAIIGDPDDDAVLACALAAGVDLIVSGDKRARNLKHFHRIPILNATGAVKLIPVG